MLKALATDVLPIFQFEEKLCNMLVLDSRNPTQFLSWELSHLVQVL
jgi:hypothetical protein